jgi:ABC-type amino acid transport substrate-binding protein
MPYAPARSYAQKIHVFFVPVARDKLLSGLLDGKVDLVAAQIAVRPAHEKFVDFTKPTRVNSSIAIARAASARDVRRRRRRRTEEIEVVNALQSACPTKRLMTR